MQRDKYWDKSWGLVQGCSHVSESCLNCWSQSMYYRFHGNDELCKNGKWTGEVRIREDRLDIPLRTKKPTVFSIWNDLYHSKVNCKFILKTYRMMSNCPQHIFLVLTKRAENMRTITEIVSRDFSVSNTKHIWHGVTAENQQRADERIPYLLKIPGKKFLSLEPLLGEIYLEDATRFFSFGLSGIGYPLNVIGAIIVGCETGPKHRPCKIEWIESIAEQCKDAGVPCFVKAINLNGKVIRDIEKFPKHLRVRELPW